MANSTLRLAILDDELLALSYLRSLCESFPDVEIVKMFNDPQTFLAEYSPASFDCLISDIVMPALSGLEVAEKLHRLPVIFTTAHNEYAADAFDIEAVDYLRKPVQRDRLERALQKVRTVIEQRQTDQLWIAQTSKGKRAVSLSEIVSFSTETFDRRDKLMLLKSGETLVIKNKSFEQLMEEVAPKKLLRISKSELLATDVIQRLENEWIFTQLKSKDGTMLTFHLSENYRKATLSALQSHQ
jgi:two-component system, LytTR family, response regulator